MGDLAGELDLAPEALVRPLVHRDLGSDRLQRDALTERQVLGLVQLAHAAARDEADDAEPVAQQIAGAEGRHDLRRTRGVGLRCGCLEPGSRGDSIVATI